MKISIQAALYARRDYIERREKGAKYFPMTGISLYTVYKEKECTYSVYIYREMRQNRAGSWEAAQKDINIEPGMMMEGTVPTQYHHKSSQSSC